MPNHLLDINDGKLAWTPYLLRYLRMKRGWSLQDTCIAFKGIYTDPAVRLVRNQVLEYELGQSIPRADRVAQLCLLFECEPSFLYTSSRAEMRARMGDLADKVLESIQLRGATVPQKNQHTMAKVLPLPEPARGG